MYTYLRQNSLTALASQKGIDTTKFNNSCELCNALNGGKVGKWLRSLRMSAL
jgi:hypothetical protein